MTKRIAYNRGKGRGFAFLVGLVGHRGKKCVLWPLARDRHGYGQCGYNGKLLRANRVMCELAHGKPPSPKHQAAHNCGKGDTGCVNPTHLEWKTNSQNQYDRRKHGTHGNGMGRRGKLTAAQVRQIRIAKGGKVSQAVLAAKYGISEGTLRGVQARRWWKHIS